MTNAWHTCVRCGGEERAGEAFLGADCQDVYTVVAAEIAAAWRAVGGDDATPVRRWLMEEVGWTGGWNVATRPRPPLPEGERRALWGS